MAVEISLKDIDRGQIAAAVNNTLLEGNNVSQWWKAQERALVTRVSRTVRAGINNGLTSQQIASNLTSQVFKGSRAQAQALVSTAINAVSNKARQTSFEQNTDVIKGKQQISTFDSRTSDICIAYSGGTWDLEGNPIGETRLPFNGGPPRHFNCRSTLIPILKSFEELGLGTQREIPPGTRASMDGQIPADMSFAQWLRTKPESFQDKILGPARAKLWRGNRITLNQLVDMRGNPLTVEQLQQLAAQKRAKPKPAPKPETPPPPPAPEEVVAWEGVPEFKKAKDAEDWLQANAVNRKGRYATAKTRTGETRDVSVSLVNSWDRTGLRIMAAVTKMMERRFGMSLPNYIGSPSKHPEFNFKRSKSLAAVHMESDSLLSQAGGLDVKRVVKRAPDVKRYVEYRIDNKRRVAQQMLKDAKEMNDPSLVKAIESYIEDDTFEFTLGDVGKETNGFANIWRTWIHESGHRMHAQFRQEIDAILQDEFKTSPRIKARGTDAAGQMKRRYLWFKQTSEYATTNNFEFVAEQFGAYMQGRHERVLPSLLKFFKSKDKGGDFGPPPELEG